jgi:serine/threonine protein kinase
MEREEMMDVGVDRRTLGDFEILGEAGAGGMGVVYKAKQCSLERVVALKVIRQDIASESEYRERFLREARLAASVSHPNVVAVYDVGESDDHLWLAMQWVEGHDLGSVIQKFGPRSPERAVAIACQIASALDAVHSAGLIHRDVKPGNVLIRDVDQKDHAYLTDFGVAKPPDHGADQLTRTGSVVGTTGYLSPEQIRGVEPGPRSDLYALGCVFFETLTGRPPFSGDNELAVRWAHANDPRPRVTDVRPDLDSRYDAFLARALAVDPQSRFRSGREFAEALVAAHKSEPTSVAAMPPPMVPPHAVTAIGPPTPLPPPNPTPLPPGQVYPGYPYATPPPQYQTGSRGGNPLALILLGLVALAGIAVGALAAAGVFSSNNGASTITSTQAAHAIAKPTTARHSVKKPPKHKVTTPPAGGTSSCGGDLSVGPDTSCPFAQNVESAYDQSSGGTTDVAAYSPVTGVTYTMHCTGGTPHVCTGGHNATVYFTSGPGSSSGSGATGATASTSLPGAPSGMRPCDQNISANSATTCPFAENVFQSYAGNYQSNGEQSDVTVSAYSPVTSTSYSMTCVTDGTTVDCTGGNNAFVTFPMHAVQVY